VIVGDFNWRQVSLVMVLKYYSHEIENILPDQNIKEIVKNYDIPNSWKLVIGEKTMINVKKNKVNDGILLPQGEKVSWSLCARSGVIRPDYQQEAIFPFHEEKLTVVKTSYLRNLRIATYTDHFPVYVYLVNK